MSKKQTGDLPIVTLDSSRSTAAYTCPMHPEVRQDEPGVCPKCGMALEPIRLAPPATRTEWVCPMHPEVVRDEPGSCPICGMALEPREGAERGEIGSFTGCCGHHPPEPTDFVPFDVDVLEAR